MKFVNACVGERAFAEATYCLSKFNLEETLEGKQCKCTLWSPAGSIVIFAALGDLASSGNMPIKGLLHKQLNQRYQRETMLIVISCSISI